MGRVYIDGNSDLIRAPEKTRRIESEELETLGRLEEPLDVRLAGAGLVDWDAVALGVLIPEDIICELFENRRKHRPGRNASQIAWIVVT